MKRSRDVSRWTWALLATAAMLAGGVWAVARHLRPVRWAGDTELTALVAERERLRENDHATLETFRARRRAQSQQGWTPDQLATVPAQLGSAWRCEWQNAGAVDRRLAVTRVLPRLRDWPASISVLHEWSAKPGVTLDSLEITAEGPARQRRFTQFAFRLRFIAADATTGNAERPVPSHGPLPVAPADRAATTRKVGPVPSLRRPSASAEPPASGPASAPARSDPPGARADLENQNQRS